MKKEMQNLVVYTDKLGFVCIEQENMYQDPSCIIIHPDQIELLINWLRDELKSPNVEKSNG